MTRRDARAVTLQADAEEDTEGPPLEASVPWWQTAVGYQIYPRSFADSDGDGIGDLRGIINRLDHLTRLGIDLVWLSPVYSSPQVDNGYDISDYQQIDPVFGTLADFDEMLQAMHARGIRLIMDLVINHTSDEHLWFQESRASTVGRCADWYVWRDPRPGLVGGEPGAEPNNWGSFFGGPAWTWAPERGQYYLHLFAPEQPDLNWESPELRAAIHRMILWWLDRGIDGFRMDVISYISKDQRFLDGEITASGFADGTAHFSHGPRLLEYLKELRERVFDGRDRTLLTVGEMPFVTVDQAVTLTDQRTGVLSMVFQFEHVSLDWCNGNRFEPVPRTLPKLKESLGRWQTGLAEHGWNSLYWGNHDQPRAVSRFGDDTCFRTQSAKTLATVLYLHRGTPFIYQGEELGMTNAVLAGVEDLRDIEAVSQFNDAIARGADPEHVMAVMRRASRDNPRGPMQWDAGPHAGFTTGRPWVPVNPNHVSINAAEQYDDPTSVFTYCAQLIELRRREPALTAGGFEMLMPEDPDIYGFVRRHASATVLVVGNLSGLDRTARVPGFETRAADLLLATEIDPSFDDLGRLLLRPWEAVVLRAGTSDPTRCAAL